MAGKKKDTTLLSDQLTIESVIHVPEIPLSQLYEPGENEAALSTQKMPEEIKKNRSGLMDEIVNASPEILSDFQQKEFSERTRREVETKVQVSFEEASGVAIEAKETLTSFDREVIDAVATLASTMEVISASTIYRVITGKDTNYNVGATQRKKIDDSMIRCSRCLVNIDMTEEFLARYPSSKKDTEFFRFRGQLITYKTFIHKAKNGENIYYQLYEMPPLFKYAEMLGKVSQFPLSLLDTPLTKKDSIIVTQSFLLRAIDELKKSAQSPGQIAWDDVYLASGIDCSVKQYKANVRNSVKKMLDYWITEDFIKSYQITTNQKGKIEFTW